MLLSCENDFIRVPKRAPSYVGLDDANAMSGQRRRVWYVVLVTAEEIIYKESIYAGALVNRRESEA